MNRISDGPWAPAIEHSLEILPPTIREMVNDVDFFCGIDPVFAGLHDQEAIYDGRSWRDTAGYFSADLTATGRPTIIIPTARHAQPWVVIHELGHALHEKINFQWSYEPVTEYAERNYYEAFAESFTVWMGMYRDKGIWFDSEPLFDRLAAGMEINV